MRLYLCAIVGERFCRNSTLSAKTLPGGSDEIMSLVKSKATASSEMASMLTTESVKDINLKVGDKATLVVTATHVLPVKTEE
jgi:molybdopterin-binding protein